MQRIEKLLKKNKINPSLNQSLLGDYVEEKHSLTTSARPLAGKENHSFSSTSSTKPSPTAVHPLMPDLLGLDLLQQEVNAIDADPVTVATPATFDILGLGDDAHIVEEKKEEEIDVLSYFADDAVAAQPVLPHRQFGIELNTVGLFSPKNVVSASVQKDEISDKEALDHAAEVALKLVAIYKDIILSDSDCKNLLTQCVLPVDLRRAERLHAVLEFQGANDAVTSPHIIEMIKTGKVEGIKGVSDFGSLNLRDLFLNKFIPFYNKFSFNEEWLRAVYIRQGTYIDNFDKRALIEAAKEDMRNVAAKPLQQKMR